MKVKYRRGRISDLKFLLDLETHSFDTDKLDARRFRYFLAPGKHDLIVQTCQSKPCGYGLLLYRKGTGLARLYSLAISPHWKGQGLGQMLLEHLEDVASKKDCTYLRLEVKINNKPAIHLYQKLGYQVFRLKTDYYQDHETALCLEKKIQKLEADDLRQSVPYFQQTTPFTCGPAALMMAMKAQKPSYSLSPAMEIEIWREATTIFMTSGIGGCGPHGLALSAARRGFQVRAYLSTEGLLFTKGVRSPEKRHVIELVQNEFDRQIKKFRIPFHYGVFTTKLITDFLKSGWSLLVLVSSYRLTGSKAPHWVVLTGINEKFVFFNDPEMEEGDTVFGNTDIPVARVQFERMARYGARQIQCLLVIKKKARPRS